MPGPGTMDLSGGGADLWLACFAESASSLDSDTRRLAPQEASRAAAMGETSRVRFVRARARLRELLAAYLPADCGPIALCSGPNGKPSLSRKHAGCNLQFNVSHCRSHALFAFSRFPVGVDIEAIRSVQATKLASRFFKPAETAALDALPQGAQAAAFIAAWTCKEACIKAVGGSVPRDLASFRLSLPIGFFTAPLAGDGSELPGWTLLPLQPEPGMLGALAVRQPDVAVRRFRLRPTPAGESRR